MNRRTLDLALRSLAAARSNYSPRLAATPDRVLTAWQRCEMEDTLLPKQREFLEQSKDYYETLFSGGYGSGKSRALCYRLVERASHRGAIEALVRKELVTLKATTLKTLLEWEGETPPVLREGTYIHRQSRQEIDLSPSGGGKIIYFGMDRMTKVGSRPMSGVSVDEAIELSEDDITMLVGRPRVRVHGIKPNLAYACNPHAPAHHLAKRFGISGDKPAPNTHCIFSSTADNPHLPPEYVAAVRAYTGMRHDRYFLGLWRGSDRLVLANFCNPTRETHVLSRPLSDFNRFGIGYDDGWTNPTAIVLVGFDGDNRAHICHVVRRSGMLLSERIAECVEVAGIVGGVTKIEVVTVDPSAADVIVELQRVGFNAVGADNSVDEGNDGMRQRLDVAGDGRARLTVEPTCGEWIKEAQSYENKPGKDEPIKENDHTMDATRYLLRQFDRFAGCWEFLST